MANNNSNINNRDESDIGEEVVTINRRHSKKPVLIDGNCRFLCADDESSSDSEDPAKQLITLTPCSLLFRNCPKRQIRRLSIDSEGRKDPKNYTLENVYGDSQTEFRSCYGSIGIDQQYDVDDVHYKIVNIGEDYVEIDQNENDQNGREKNPIEVVDYPEHLNSEHSKSGDSEKKKKTNIVEMGKRKSINSHPSSPKRAYQSEEHSDDFEILDDLDNSAENPVVGYPIKPSSVDLQVLNKMSFKGQLVRQIRYDYVQKLSGVNANDLFSSSNPQLILISMTPTLQHKAIVVEGNHRLSAISSKKKLTEKEERLSIRCGIIVVGEDEFESIWENSYHIHTNIVKNQKQWEPASQILTKQMKMTILASVSKESRRCGSEMSRFDEATFYNAMLSEFITDSEKEELRSGSPQMRNKKFDELVEQNMMQNQNSGDRCSSDVFHIFLMNRRTQCAYMRGLRTDKWPTSDHILKQIFNASIADDKSAEECLESFLMRKQNVNMFRNQLVAISAKSTIVDVDDATSIAKKVRNIETIGDLSEASNESCILVLSSIKNYDKDVIIEKKLTLLCIGPTKETMTQLLSLDSEVGSGIVNNRIIDSTNGFSVYFIAGNGVVVSNSTKTHEAIVPLIQYHKNTPEADIKLFELIANDDQ